MEEETIEIAINGRFNVRELQDIIRSLGEARASMSPEVSAAPEDDPDNEAVEQNEPVVFIRRRVSGGIRIWLRNDGFGWLAFTFTAEKAERLREFLGNKVPGLHRVH